MKSQRGMTLIETTVAVALLAIIVVSILSAFSAATIAATRHAQLTSLDRLTRSDAEFIKSQTYIVKGGGAYSNLSAAGYSFSPQVLYYDPALGNFAAGYKDSGLQQIVLTVTGPNSVTEQLDLLKVQP